MSGSFSLSDLLAVEEGQFGARPRGLRRVDARVKLAFCAAAVLWNALLPDPRVSAALLLLAWAGLISSRVTLGQAAWFILAPAWAVSLVVLGFGAGFGHTALLALGPVTFYKEGLAQGLQAGLRVLAEMSWAAALVLTTPFTQVLQGLRWWKVPEVLVDTLGYMYRYLFLLHDEFNAMRTAARARGGYSSLSAGWHSSGQIVAHVFLRALERAGRIQQAIRARGGE